MLTNSYVWSSSPYPTILPEKLAVPLCVVSKYLGIAPIVTHASLDLYNWDLIDESKEFSLDNLRCNNLFTGTDSEQWFYLIMTAIEQVGGNVIKCILDISSNKTNYPKMKEILTEMNMHCEKMCKIIVRMKERCEPEVFWNVLRPFLGGWKNNDKLPDGLIYEGVSTEGLQLFGGSAAQSSLFQVIDASLGIVHNDVYFTEIQQYMPEKHRDFVNYVKHHIPIWKFVKESDDCLAEFNEIVATIAKFRKLHMALVHRYIIRMVSTNTSDPVEPSSEDSTQSEKGTGGTELKTFLKTSIEETSNATVKRCHC
jgi:indoleamine 2,3-dioxygenase